MIELDKSRRVRVVAEVTDVRASSPRMRRITLGGAELAAFLQANGVETPAAWVKVSLPGGEKRAYTIRGIDRQAGTLDLEFVLHGEYAAPGPASAWASRARIGERIGIAGPRDGGFALPADARWVLLAGDATALPAIQTIAQALPPGIRAEVCVELHSQDDRQDIASRAGIEVAWLQEHGATPGIALLQTLAKRPLPNGPGYVWIAGESNAVRALRAHYLDARGLEARRVSARGYWKTGEAAHRDRGANAGVAPTLRWMWSWFRGMRGASCPPA
ncbi:MAG: siderophore-interacting protein [Candidatus Accumulibacter sp.]|nr:siderophore-interacting protein [Accumulibacter sp.]